jgi:ketosteroid isomerase-like protein
MLSTPPGPSLFPLARSAAFPSPLIFNVTPYDRLVIELSSTLNGRVRSLAMNALNVSAASLVSVALAVASIGAQTPAPNLQAAADQIVKSDAAFAQSVAEKDRTKFLSFIAEVTTFNGGAANELHGRDAVMKAWGDFFAPDGPTLSWTPTKGEVIGAGDVGYTTGRSVFRQKDASGKVTERRGQYVTIWRKQPDGSWKVVFDTGSTLP